MARKTYRVLATFPDLPSAHAEQEARAEGGNVRAAVNAALREILTRDGVKRKRIRRIGLAAVQIADSTLPGDPRAASRMRTYEKGG